MRDIWKLAEVMLVVSCFPKNMFCLPPSAPPLTLNNLIQQIHYLNLTINTFTGALNFLFTPLDITPLPPCLTNIWQVYKEAYFGKRQENIPSYSHSLTPSSCKWPLTWTQPRYCWGFMAVPALSASISPPGRSCALSCESCCCFCDLTSSSVRAEWQGLFFWATKLERLYLFHLSKLSELFPI